MLRTSAFRLFFLALSLSITIPILAATKDTPNKKAASKDISKNTAVSEEAHIRKAIEAKFPGVEVSHVGKTPFAGLFEVMVGDSMAYTDSKVSFVLLGQLIEPNTRTNLTQERLRKLKAIPWAQLPLDLAIKTVKGSGARKVAVFSDADCPYCKRLEKELAKISDVTIYTFLYPIPELHPDAARKSKIVWCAEDRNKAWDDLMLNGQLAAGDGSCDNPVDRIVELGKKYRISATPTLVFGDGRTVPGALPLAQLEAELNKSEGLPTAKQSPPAKETPSVKEGSSEKGAAAAK